jgi:hypothetical protein
MMDIIALLPMVAHDPTFLFFSFLFLIFFKKIYFKEWHNFIFPIMLIIYLTKKCLKFKMVINLSFKFTKLKIRVEKSKSSKA